MRKIMIFPLVVGVLLMMISMTSLATVNGSYQLDDKGNPALTNSQPVRLQLAENGIQTSPWYQVDQWTENAVNNQSGDHFRVYAIATTGQQYCKFVLNDQLNVKIALEFRQDTNRFWITAPPGRFTIDRQTLIEDVNDRGVIQVLSNVDNGNGTTTNYILRLYVSSFLNHSKVTDLQNGYGYSIYATATESAKDALGIQKAAGSNIFGSDGLIVIFISAAIIGGISAITIFGSKIDAFGQRLIFTSATYLLIWSLLSIGMYPTISTLPTLGPLLWFALTGMYLFGMMGTVMNDGE